MVKLRYIHYQRGSTAHVGILNPGEIVEVSDEVAEILLRGFFELVDKKSKVTKRKKRTPKTKECTKCPKEE